MQPSFSPLNFTSNHYKSSFRPYRAKPEEREDLFVTLEHSKNQEDFSKIKSFYGNIPKTYNNYRIIRSYLAKNRDHDSFLKGCSKNNIETTIANFETSQEGQQKQAQRIQRIFTQGGVDASNYEMILQLIDEGKISPLILDNKISQDGFSKNFIEDLDKIFAAKMEGKTLEETFVPKFDTIEDAALNLKTGEVCSISGDKNISIKLNSGEVKELSISPQTYLELFPPAQRFSLIQGLKGDCYVLAAIQALYENPSSRHIILEMFKENPDGTLDVSFNNGDEGLKDVQKITQEAEHSYCLQYEAQKIIEILTAKTFQIDLYEGGFAENIFEKLGLEAETMTSYEVGSLLSDSDFNSKYVLCASTDMESEDLNIFKDHCYIIKKFEDDKFAILNPHNTSVETIVNKSFLLNYFEDFAVGYIN